ncbi:unnamed protein product [Closterium sp. NIES-54]
MHSRLLVSGLPTSLPPLSPSPAPLCLPCVEGRQHAAPHSSLFPPKTAPLQTLHMDVKGEVPDVLIPCIGAVRLHIRERFREDLPVLHLYADRGGEFSSDLLRDFFCGEGILQLFTLPASPQQNGIAERRIGLVMEVARTSMIHAAAPHFLWSFVIRYAAHQLNLWPRVSLPETSPILRWTGKVGDASVFRVWSSRAFVRDTSADKLSFRAIPCIFLGFPPDAPGWQIYHHTSRRVLPSQGVTFDESVPFYCLLPYRSAPLPPPPLFLAPDSGAARGDASGGVASGGAASGGSEHASAEPGGAAPEGAEREGAEPGGAEPEGAEPGGPEPKVAEPGSAESGGAGSGGAGPRGIASSGGPAAAGAGDSAAGGTGAGGAGATSLGGAGVPAVAGGTEGAVAAGPGGARTRGTGAVGAGGVGGAGAGGAGAGGTGAGGTGAGEAGAGDPGAGAGGTGPGGPGAGGAGAGGTGAGGAGAGGTRAVDPGAGGACAGGAAPDGTGAGGTVQRRPFFVPPPPSSLPPPDSVLRHVLSLPSSIGLPPSLLSPPPR